MPNYTIDTLKHIVSFLNWTCDLETFETTSELLKLTSNEKQQILAYWKSKTIFRTVVSDGWYFKLVNGIIHCDDGPASECNNGEKTWCINGQLHRVDGPASITELSKWWYFKNKKHRANGLPAVTNSWGFEWWEHDQRHRLDGPAVVYNSGYKEWWVRGQLHRIDGPAVEYSNECSSYWLNGVQVSGFTFWFRKITCRI